MGSLRYFTSVAGTVEGDWAIADLRGAGVRAECRSDLVAIGYPFAPTDLYVDEDDWELAQLVRPDLFTASPAITTPLVSVRGANRRVRQALGLLLVVALVAPVVAALVR